jgi:hypothetical protein
VKPKPTKEFLYALANEVTGMDLVRSVWAKNIGDARNKVDNIARCFGKTTVIIGVEEVNAPQLKLQGGASATTKVSTRVLERDTPRHARDIPKRVPSRRRAR